MSARLVAGIAIVIGLVAAAATHPFAHPARQNDALVQPARPDQQVATPSAREREDALAGYFPNVMVTTHEKRRVRFYDDLVKGRTVAINFMFASCTAVCPLSTDNLRKVQEPIQARLGKDVLMLSISIDPRSDTPDVLARYAADHGSSPAGCFSPPAPKIWIASGAGWRRPTTRMTCHSTPGC